MAQNSESCTTLSVTMPPTTPIAVHCVRENHFDEGAYGGTYALEVP